VLRPFRFGLHFWELPVEHWTERVRRYEALGYSTITFTDHVVVPQWEPLTALGAIAAVTERIGLGTLVLDTALRDPVLTARSAATVHQISGGRLELGLGAGYVAANFAASGVPFARAPERVHRLEEFVGLLRRLWTDPSTTVQGRYFSVDQCPVISPGPVPPRLLIGGGGPMMLHLAGRAADTVSVIPRQASGDWSVPDSMADATPDRLRQKTDWARQGAVAAGRDPETLELNTLVVKTIVDDHPAARMAEASAAAGVTPADLADSSLYLCGTPSQVCELLLRRRRDTGLTSYSLFDPGEEQIERLARDVLAPLAAE
jgi:probable F420-dependent oxidoreductase